MVAQTLYFMFWWHKCNVFVTVAQTLYFMFWWRSRYILCFGGTNVMFFVMGRA
jgi:hypothetical protein